MQVLNFICKKQILTVECSGQPVIARSRGHIYAQFNLDDEWNGLSVTAIFTNDFGSASYERQLTTKLVEIPPEDPCYEQVRGLVKVLNYVQEADADDEIPPTSIVREFIGGNRFYI